MTNSGIYNTEESSAPSGFCSAPQPPLRWTQGLTVPAECFSVRLDVHQSPGRSVYCYAFEVKDGHTQELLAKVVEPARDRSQVLPLASAVSVDLRGILLALTDPEPF